MPLPPPGAEAGGDVLSASLEALVRVSAALASRDPAALDGALDTAVPAVSPAAMEEVLLQSYLFVGYPITLNALARWRVLSGLPASETVEEDWSLWLRRGPEVCRAVYGTQYEALRRNVRSLHPELERWMIAEGYGKVLGRPGLSLRDRELCIVALLAVLRTPRQLYSHLRGAMAVGADPVLVEAVLEVAGAFLDEEGRADVARTWGRVRARGIRRTASGGGND